MKIALSGASGSIGSKLKDFLGLKHQLSCISFKTKHTLDNKILKSGVDILLHLASLNTNLKSDKDRITELEIAKNAMSFCKYNDIKSLVFFSTSQVYSSGDISLKVFKETNNCSPKNNYALAKLDCEHYLTEECKANNIDLIILRSCPFIDLKSNTKIAFLGNLAKNFKLSVEFNKANVNSRSFLTIKNLFLILEGILVYLENSDSKIYKIFNIGDKYPISTNTAVKIIAEKYSAKPVIIRVPKIFELITSKIPLIRRFYENLISNHAIDISSVEQTLRIKLLETHESLLND